MILMSSEIMAALEREATTLTATIDMIQLPDLIAGESVVLLGERRYGVLRYERIDPPEGGNERLAKARLIALS